MADQIQVPVKMINGERWGCLTYLSEKHEFCAEKVDVKEKFSFAGQHRMRYITLRKGVYWKISEGMELDISRVSAEPAVRRRQG